MKLRILTEILDIESLAKTSIHDTIQDMVVMSIKWDLLKKAPVDKTIAKKIKGILFQEFRNFEEKVEFLVNSGIKFYKGIWSEFNSFECKSIDEFYDHEILKSKIEDWEFNWINKN